MKHNMREWIDGMLCSGNTAAFPLAIYTGAALTGRSVHDMLFDGSIHADCVTALAGRFPRSAASITAMDLSVEAEAFGGKILAVGDEPPTITGSIINGEDGAEKLRVPPVGAGRTGEFLKAASICANTINDRPVFGCIIGPFSLAGRLSGMTEALMNIHAEPDMLHAVIRKTTEFLVSYALAFREAGADGIVIAEPAAGLVSPSHCGEFSSDYITSIVKAVQDESFPVIVHNCSATVRHIGSMLSTGAAGLHLGNTIDMRDALAVIPPGIPAFGNIDPVSVLRNGSEDEIRSKTMDLLKSVSGFTNFVLSSGCDIPPGTPAENLDIFFDTLDRFNTGN